MPLLQFEVPLAWPDGMPTTPRNQQRADHGFPSPLNLTESIELLDQELMSLPAGSATIYLDIERPTLDRLRKKLGSRSGACLRFKYQGRSYTIACDRWQTPEHNIYALHLTLRQWRNIERWGIGALPALLAAFEAEAAPMTKGEPGILQPWMEELGLGVTATLEDAVAIYHRRAKLAAHDTDALVRLNVLMDEAREYFSGKS